MRMPKLVIHQEKVEDPPKMRKKPPAIKLAA